MRILHVHLRNRELTNEAITRALRGISDAYECVDWLDIDRRSGPGEVNSRVLQIAATMSPDLVFYQTQSSDILTTATVDTLRERGSCVMGWSGDVRDPLPPHYLRMAPHVSCSLFSNWSDVHLLRGMGHRSDYLNIGYEDTIYRFDGPTTSCPPIVFLGTNYGDTFPNSQHRRDMVVSLREVFGSRFQVYGGGWGTRFLAPHEEAAVYRSCAVAINQEHFTRDGFNSDRRFRAVACGAPLYDWIVDDMPTERHIERIRHMMAHPATTEQRLEIARAARADTWEARMPRLMDLQHTYR